MPTRYLAITLLLLVLALVGRAERLAYTSDIGRMDYRYELTIAGQMQPPRGVPLPVTLQMSARTIDQVTEKPQKGLSPVTMSIKDIQVSGSSGEEEFGDDVPATVLSFLRSPSGVLSKLRYDSTPSKSDSLIPGLENAWLLFSRFGHHLRLPEKELRAGEKWQSAETIEMSTGKTMALKTESTLVGDKVVDGKRYVQIDSNFKLSTPKQKLSPDEEKDAGLSVEIEMTGKSYLLFDPRAGEVFRSTIKATMTTKTAMGTETRGTKNAMAGNFRITVTAQRTPPPAQAKK